MLRALFETFPILMGIIAVIMCSFNFGQERRKQHKIIMILGIVCSLILVVAQLSWWSSFIVVGVGVGTAFADLLWTIFNTLTMLAFVIAALPQNQK